MISCHHKSLVCFQRFKHDLRSASIVGPVSCIFRPVVHPLDVRAHAAVLANRTLLIVVVLARIATVDLRQVLCARVARDGVASGAGDDVALEEHVDGLERYAWRLG